MKKSIIAVVLMISVITISAFMLSGGCVQAIDGPTVIIGDQKVQVEIADTNAKRRVGLMQRKHLGENKGMLFILESPQYPVFWMKDCFISLDIIFINEDKVVQIYNSVPPCKENPCPQYPCVKLADKALEVNAGFTKKHNIQIGDTLQYKGFRN